MSQSIERELSEVERQIGRLRIDYERYFTGDLKLAPLQARRRLDLVFRKLWDVDLERAADRFRRQMLQDRFTTLMELMEKRIRAREEGRRLAPRETGRESAGPGTAPPGQAAGRPPEPGGDAGAASSVKGKAKVDFRPLFDKYRAARNSMGEDVSRLQYERFEELVRQQAEEIRKRTGSTRLVFEIRTEGGKVRLVGRPAPGKG
jgi:hypothetical protein